MDSSATFTTLGPVMLARFYADSGGKFTERSLLCSCPFRSPYAHPRARTLHRKGRALGARSRRYLYAWGGCVTMGSFYFIHCIYNRFLFVCSFEYKYYYARCNVDTVTAAVCFWFLWHACIKPKNIKVAQIHLVVTVEKRW